MNYFVDTNVFLRFLIKEDPQTHQECADLLELVKKEELEIYISSIILAEIAWMLRSFYDQPKSKRIKALKAIAGLKKVKFLEEFNPLLAINLFQNNKVKFVDALVASIIRGQDENWTIISYDDDFDKLGVVRKEPSEII